MKRRLEVLQKIPIFKDVTPETLTRLGEIARPINFKKGDIIIKEGEAGSCMFILVDGSVKITKNITLSATEPNSEGIEKDLIMLSGEDLPVFGEMSLLEEDVRTATVTALADVELWRIDKDDFREAAEKDYKSAYFVVLEIARIISSRLRKTDRDIVKLTTVLGIALSRDRG